MVNTPVSICKILENEMKCKFFSKFKNLVRYSYHSTLKPITMQKLLSYTTDARFVDIIQKLASDVTLIHVPFTFLYNLNP